MGEWRRGVFGCFDNIGLSCLICYAFPLAVGKNAEAVGEKSPILWVLATQFAPCVAGALLRELIRKQKGIEGSFCGDCLLWWLCPCFALCQETKETNSMAYLLEPESPSMQRSVTPGF